MSQKKKARKAARAAQEKKRMERVIKGLLWAFGVLIIISVIAFLMLGNAV